MEFIAPDPPPFWWAPCPQTACSGAWVADSEADLPPVGGFVICQGCGMPARVRYSTEDRRKLEAIDVADVAFWRSARDGKAIFKTMLWWSIRSGYWLKRLIQSLRTRLSIALLWCMQFLVIRKLTWWRHYELQRVAPQDISEALVCLPRMHEGSKALWVPSVSCCAGIDWSHDPALKGVIRCEGKTVPRHPELAPSEADTSDAGTRPAP